MVKPTKPKLGKWQKFCNFFKETFRGRGKSDYKEFFTRGLRGRESSAKVEHGWMYVRVFVLLFPIFSLIAFLIAYAGNGIVVPTLYLLGGVLLNLTVAVFIYELNSERNLSFALFMLIMIIGTVAADLITILGYRFYYPKHAWLSVTWTAVLEEVAKAIPAIVAILVFKKRSPVLGFIIGAAVGAGFSITEDMGYIYAYSYSVDSMVKIAMERSWTAICTHTLWTAVIGWAFCKFKCKPYEPRFLLVAVSSSALHFLWDMPVEGGLSALAVLLCVIAAMAFSAVVIIKERKSYKKEPVKTSVQLVIPMPVDKNRAQKQHAKRCSYAANFIASVTALFLGVVLILWCFAPIETVFITKKFKYDDEFINYVQDGKTFCYKWNKDFDDCLKVSEIDYAIVYEGKYVSARISVVEEDGYKYTYTFSFSENKETGQNVGKVIAISVEVSEEEYQIFRLEVPEKTSSEEQTYRYVNYVKLNSFKYSYYDRTAEEYVIVLGWYYDHTAQHVVLAFAGGILIAGVAAFTAFKIKSKKLRRKENVG